MKTLTKSTNKDPQLDFFFWLGADGEIVSVTEEEFMKEQENWDGLRPQGERNGQRPSRND